MALRKVVRLTFANRLRSPNSGIATACRRWHSHQWSIAAALTPARHR
jgi:hypothetical protein